MKRILLLSLFLIFGLSTSVYSQWGANSPSIEYLGSTDNEDEWKLNCDTWKRTVRGMEGQLPQETVNFAVQYLIEYTKAYGQIGEMKMEIYDVWAIQYPNYIVFVWFTNYDEGRWTYKSMNILTY